MKKGSGLPLPLDRCRAVRLFGSLQIHHLRLLTSNLAQGARHVGELLDGPVEFELGAILEVVGMPSPVEPVDLAFHLGRRLADAVDEVVRNHIGVVIDYAETDIACANLGHGSIPLLVVRVRQPLARPASHGRLAGGRENAS